MPKPAPAAAALQRGAFDAQRPRRAVWLGRPSLLQVAAACAATAALASVAVTLIRLPALLAAVYRNSDASAISYIAQGLATGHGPQLLPTQTSVAVVWFDELLQWLPRDIRMGVEYWTGPALSLIAGLLAVRTAALVTGRRGAIWLAVLFAVVPAAVLWPLLFPDNHVTTYLGAALLAWLLVHDLRDGPRLSRSLVVGAGSGLFVVTDPQLIVFGLVPWLVATFLMRRHLSAPQARSALVTATAAVAGSGLTLLVMASQGIRTVDILPGSGGGAAGSVSMALRGAGWIFSGSWYGDALTPASAALCAAVAAGLIAVLIRGRAVRSEASDGGGDERRALRAYRAFWASAALCLLAAFVLLGYGGAGPLSAHYLVGCYFALAAVLASAPGLRRTPANASRAARALAVAALAAFAVYAGNTAARTAALDAAQYDLRLHVPAAMDPLPVLLGHHLQRGYAGYWEAYDLDWRSGGRLSVWPLLAGARACSGSAGSLCAYSLAPAGEYTPSRGPTFLITPWAGGWCGASTPSVDLFGPPRAVYTAGPYTISVYAYDVAARFGRTTGLFC